jgi:tRNA(fMet)-specific endonuclease VapC
MIYLLDTNACIRYLNGRSLAVVTRVSATPPDRITLCSVVKGEMWFGARRSADPVSNRARQDAFFAQFITLPYDDHAAEHYSILRADLAGQGRLIGPNDMMIAAIALAHSLILVTHNIDEFSRVNGLKLEDWEV